MKNSFSEKNLKRRIQRDWLAIDYAVFNMPVTEETFSSEFEREWKLRKRTMLANFYESLSILGLNNETLYKCCIESIHENAKTLAKKARKLAIQRLKKLPYNLVKEVTNLYSYDGKDKALVKATKLILAFETLGHFIGEQNNDTKDILYLLALSLK